MSAAKKKLQVFVSSTYEDLREQRQAAVEAILSAGHIPAGMELFAAGDKGQMDVIRKWIDDSDVFFLILGGRYGSIEPKTKMSYIHLEFEYAIERLKPTFAATIGQKEFRRRTRKSDKLVEREKYNEWKSLKELVETRIVRTWDDTRDIKVCVHETLSDFARRDDLAGWIKSNEVASSPKILEEIARLSSENATLKGLLETQRGAPPTADIQPDEWKELLNNEELPLPQLPQDLQHMISRVAKRKLQQPNLNHFFWVMREQLIGGNIYLRRIASEGIKICLHRLCKLGLLAIQAGGAVSLTQSGHSYYIRLRLDTKDLAVVECAYSTEFQTGFVAGAIA